MLPQVAADPEALVQVFLNLGLNALQAMPEGGTLEILTTRRRRSRLGLRAVRRGAAARHRPSASPPTS
jgi:nitrogen-specific signal transduction histidine kinase